MGCRLSFYKKSVVTSSDHLWTRTWAKIGKQQCQQIPNWNRTSRRCSRWSQFVVLDLVGQQVQPGATLHSKTFHGEPPFIIFILLTVQARICGVLVPDRQACRAWQLVLELHQGAGQESCSNWSWCYTLRIERMTNHYKSNLERTFCSLHLFAYAKTVVLKVRFLTGNRKMLRKVVQSENDFALTALSPSHELLVRQAVKGQPRYLPPTELPTSFREHCNWQDMICSLQSELASYVQKTRRQKTTIRSFETL